MSTTTAYSQKIGYEFRTNGKAYISTSYAGFEIRHRTDREDHEARRANWVEQIEAEYSTREEATKRQIMAEIDARLRNERISLETSLDLVRQETALDLEVTINI